MKITNIVIKDIIRKLIKNEAYGTEINNLLNAEFMEYAIEFFKKVAIAKLTNQAITTDWYKKEMLNNSLSSRELAINSGTNEKTISNNFNSGRREIIIDASVQHYEKLSKLISNLVESNNEINLTLTIKLNGVAVDLDINESLIVISSLAAKRDALNGGLWSTAGKKVEKPLMT
jgi:CfrBI restriction endonuclease